MLKGAELLAWARERAEKAAGKDTGLLLGASWNAVTLAIAEAYMGGAIAAIQDEIERKGGQL